MSEAGLPASPAQVFGDLFETVQRLDLFPDSKTFADADPRRPVAAILTDWAKEATRDADRVRAFVAANFTLPDTAATPPPADRLPLAEHVTALWPMLTRDPVTPPEGSSLLALPRRHVVPGGRFRELYYWDSYFTMLGLARSGRQDLIEDMIADFGSLLDRYGRIPNGTRTYYLGRSHPPVFYLMASLSHDRSDAARRQRLEWMRIEHRFWMRGADALAPGEEGARVVRMRDGALLNRYWDDRLTPRDESWREDVALALAAPHRPATQIWRDLRAAAESGWDFSSRWLGDRRTLETIRTTRILPIDLNALLYGLETAIAHEAAALGDAHAAAGFAARAEARRRAIATHLWNDAAGFYADHDLDAGVASDQPTAAMAFALFTGAADPAHAAHVAAAIERLLAPHGLLTTLEETGQQWDSPNGWAPLQWVAIAGLERYGHDALADRIARGWAGGVAALYETTGQLFEKYDVLGGAIGGGGEYAPETGFGWTNGVVLEILSRRQG